MALDTILTWSCSEQKWVDQMRGVFEVSIDIDTKVCIFQVPQAISIVKPDAYTPQLIALGPYHHFKPLPYQMQSYKLGKVKQLLKKPGHVVNFQHLLIDELKKDVIEIRSCYRNYLDIDDETLAWIMAIDGTFLIHFLQNYNYNIPPKKDENQSGAKDKSTESNLVNTNFSRGASSTPLVPEKKNSLGDDYHDNDKITQEKENDDDDDYDSGDYIGSTSRKEDDSKALELTQNAMVRDIIMVENQVPIIVLKKIWKTLKLSSHENQDDDDDDGSTPELVSLLNCFCKAQSPLNLAVQKSPASLGTSAHLLGLMYNLIPKNPRKRKPVSIYRAELQFHIINYVEEGVSALAAVGVPGAIEVKQSLTFVQNLPWERISGLVDKLENKQPNQDRVDQTPLVEEIKIPSVTQMCNIAKIKFSATPPDEEGIGYINFNEEQREFYLPPITLNANSEVILRNLVAYDQLASKPGTSTDDYLVLSQYVDLMCGIIGTPEDSKLLREAGVIVNQSSLNDEEIAILFNGINKSSSSSGKIKKIIDTVNDDYEKLPRVKVLKLLKKHVYASWRFLTFVATILLILLLCLQAFCQVYGCNRFWR